MFIILSVDIEPSLHCVFTYAWLFQTWTDNSFLYVYMCMFGLISSRIISPSSVEAAVSMSCVSPVTSFSSYLGAMVSSMQSSFDVASPVDDVEKVTQVSFGRLILDLSTFIHLLLVLILNNRFKMWFLWLLARLFYLLISPSVWKDIYIYNKFWFVFFAKQNLYIYFSCSWFSCWHINLLIIIFSSFSNPQLCSYKNLFIHLFSQLVLSFAFSLVLLIFDPTKLLLPFVPWGWYPFLGMRHGIEGWQLVCVCKHLYIYIYTYCCYDLSCLWPFFVCVCMYVM